MLVLADYDLYPAKSLLFLLFWLIITCIPPKLMILRVFWLDIPKPGIISNHEMLLAKRKKYI
jgi:hypothetical protein